ncbi:proteasome subunit alpha type-3-like [Dioscorea cayenensis subsp. rotundata]|uniref:Proteasome subunit alpha type-3-like n=1 Tax=Dioscorea cayennensis subsp. rotundata TaxID=55577 RepID=A0AB40BIB5_DIOCR|nr:proteasome subunit alpha type-3-like [Dioscorea cayenensis subsp. rotundata]
MGGTYLELLPHAMDVDRVANTFLEAKPGNGDVALDEDLDETMEENENILNDMSSVSIFFETFCVKTFQHPNPSSRTSRSLSFPTRRGRRRQRGSNEQHRNGLRSLRHHLLPRWSGFPDRVRRQGHRQQRDRDWDQMQRWNCYVLGVEKLISSKMMLPEPNRRIHAVHRHSGMVIASLAADGRQIVTRAKSKATIYEKVYGEPIPVKELTERVTSYVHLCTLYWWLEVMIGMDLNCTWLNEPSGVSYRYFGAAFGRQAAKTEIEKLKLSGLTCRQGVIEVAKIIYGVHDEAKDKAFELEMSWVCEESNRQHQKMICWRKLRQLPKQP